MTTTPSEAATVPAPTTSVAQARPAHRELAVAGSVADLSDRELAALLDGIESLDAMPSTEVETGSLAPAAAPAPATTSTSGAL